MKKSLFSLISLFFLISMIGGCCPCSSTLNSDGRVLQDNKIMEKAQPIQKAVPRTNAEIRQWYNDQVGVISNLNEQWVKEGVSLEKRAHRAYEIRHKARIGARAMMKDKMEVTMLEKRDMKKYGNPDGPTFKYLVEKNRKKGMSQDESYEAIIGSSKRTNSKYNKKYGVEKKDP
ncbi:hypothetical protein QUF76_07660 [Desulfobacterales bacterium HSG16]|nr:hypothetical protein [Desulfobacterales bacterium HSG16]